MEHAAIREPKGRVNSRPMVDLILDHLNQFGSITALEAQARYRVRALPRRICDLKELGYRITKEWRKDDSGQRYVRYFLSGSEPAPVKPVLRVGARIRLTKDNLSSLGNAFGKAGDLATVIRYDGPVVSPYETGLEVEFDNNVRGRRVWMIETPGCFEVIG